MSPGVRWSMWSAPCKPKGLHTRPCVEGNLVTSRVPHDLPAFCQTIVKALSGWGQLPRPGHLVCPVMW